MNWEQELIEMEKGIETENIKNLENSYLENEELSVSEENLDFEEKLKVYFRLCESIKGFKENGENIDDMAMTTIIDLIDFLEKSDISDYEKKGIIEQLCSIMDLEVDYVHLMDEYNKEKRSVFDKLLEEKFIAIENVGDLITLGGEQNEIADYLIQDLLNLLEEYRIADDEKKNIIDRACLIMGCENSYKQSKSK